MKFSKLLIVSCNSTFHVAYMFKIHKLYIHQLKPFFTFVIFL